MTIGKKNCSGIDHVGYLSLVATIVFCGSVYADDLPSLDMLEFLGGWDNGEGQSLDPIAWMEFFEEPLFDNKSINSSDSNGNMINDIEQSQYADSSVDGKQTMNVESSVEAQLELEQHEN